MPKYTKKEFADLCGMQSNNFAVYVKRGKIIVENDLIDDSNQKNLAFYKKYSQKVIARGEAPAELVSPISKPSRQKPEDSNENDYAALEKEKLKEQVEKLKNENNKLKLGNEKTVGKFVAVELVKGLIVQLSEAIHLAWENELEDYILKFASQNQLTREEITILKMEKNNSVNSSKVKAILHAKAMLRDMQLEAGTKRGVGEHD